MKLSLCCCRPEAGASRWKRTLRHACSLSRRGGGITACGVIGSPGTRARKRTIHYAKSSHTVVPTGFRRCSGTRKTLPISTTSSEPPESSTMSSLRMRIVSRDTRKRWGTTGYLYCPSRRPREFITLPVRRAGPPIRSALQAVGCHKGMPNEPKRSNCSWTPPFQKDCIYSTET